MDCRLPSSSVHGIHQARILEWVAILFFRESSQLRDRTWVSCRWILYCMSHLGSPLMIQIYDFGFWKNPMFNLISHFPTSNECQKKRGYLELRRSLGQGVGRASQLVLVVNNLSANSGDARCGSDPWHGKIPWRRKWQPTPVFLPEKLHRQRSLVGYSPWGHIKLDVTEYACPARWYRESDQSS